MSLVVEISRSISGMSSDVIHPTPVSRLTLPFRFALGSSCDESKSPDYTTRQRPCGPPVSIVPHALLKANEYMHHPRRHA
jgi:hypothetical protein